MEYDINRQFDSHPLNNIQQNYVTALRGHTKDLADLVVHGCKDGREKSLALTKLEECLMWAVKAVAVEEFNGGIE